WIRGEGAYPRLEREGRIVEPRQLLPPPHPLGQVPELAVPQRELKVLQPVVVAEMGHLVVPAAFLLPLPRVLAESMVAKRAHAPGEIGPVRRDHPALPCRDVLDGMEAEGRESRSRTDRAV